MDALLELGGVGVPTASTLLYFAFPDDYPILDVRALHALGHKPRSAYPIGYWLPAPPRRPCGPTASRSGSPPRTPAATSLWSTAPPCARSTRRSGSGRRSSRRSRT